MDALRTDEDLMRAYLAGDAAAFEAIYRRYSRRVYGFFFRALGEQATAEDLLQLPRKTAPGPRAALWASAALVALALACPMAELTDFCRGFSLLGQAAAAYFVVGLLHGLAPALVGFAVTRRQPGRRLARQGAILALETSLFFLQCRPFTAGTFLTTFLGALAGTGLAGLVDLPWPLRRSPRAPR
jgi:hypothetical protein